MVDVAIQIQHCVDHIVSTCSDGYQRTEVIARTKPCGFGALWGVGHNPRPGTPNSI